MPYTKSYAMDIPIDSLYLWVIIVYKHKIVTIPKKFIFQVTSSLPSPLLLLKLPIHNWNQNKTKLLKRTKQRAVKTIRKRNCYCANKWADKF